MHTLILILPFDDNSNPNNDQNMLLANTGNQSVGELGAKINPFTDPKISLVILLTVCYTVT